MNPYRSETKFRELLISPDSGINTRPHTFRRQPAQSLRVSAPGFDLHNTGRQALHIMDACAPDFADFARAVWLNGADTLPQYPHIVQELEFDLIEDPARIRSQNYAAWFAFTIHQRIVKKLGTHPVEGLFVSGAHSAGGDLPVSIDARSARSPNEFLNNLSGADFSIVVTPAQIPVLGTLLDSYEIANGLEPGAIPIEVVIASNAGVIDNTGRVILRDLARSTQRIKTIYFDGSAYLTSIDVPAAHHHTRHEACNFMRQLLKLALADTGIALSDLSVPREYNASDPASIRRAWREHFNNVTYALADGFYHGIDHSPAMLPARYAALFSFYIEALPAQAEAFKKALRTDTPDLVSAQKTLNFFLRGLDCGGLELDEVVIATGLSPDELNKRSITEIVSTRGTRAAGR